MNFEPGRRFSIATVTGLMAAALAANSPIFAMRLGPAAPVRARLDRLKLSWTCIGAFTVPITQGRRLEVIRATGGPVTGGSPINDIGQRFSGENLSAFDDSLGGDVRVATVGALGYNGAIVEVVPQKIMTLSHLGAAGAYGEALYQYDPNNHDEIAFAPGDSLIIRTPAAVAMDAAGTWQLAIEADWREVRIAG